MNNLQSYTELKAWLADNHESLVRDILEVLNIDSESYNRKGVDKALKTVLSIAKRLGFRTELRANDEIGVVSFGEGSETLGILAHVDVVPIGDMKLWTHSPYGEISNGRIYGRGIADDKGMVISCLYAMAAVKSLNMPVYKKAELIIGTREEIKWTDFELYNKEGHPTPDYGFTPDGEFPILNREKGNCDVLLSFDKSTCDGDLELLGIESGEAVNSVPGIAKVKIKGNIDLLIDKLEEFNRDFIKKLEYEIISKDEIIVTCYGKEAHSSEPELGDNALDRLCAFLSKFNFNDYGVNSFIRFIKDNFNGNYNGETLGLPAHPEYRNGEYMGKTTVVPSLCRYDNGIKIYLNIRTVYGATKEEILNAFDILRNKYNFQYSIEDIQDPLYVQRDHKFMDVLAKAYEFITHEKADFLLANGTSYAKALPNVVAYGPIFPSSVDSTHQVDEYLTVEDLKKVTEIYTLVIGETLLNSNSLK